MALIIITDFKIVCNWYFSYKCKTSCDV